MTWSFSDSRIFRNCQRQWFYKEHVASDNPRHALGFEAFLLSKLQSVAAWRGNIVDDTIEKDIVPILRRGRTPDPDRVLENARKRFDTQLDFARQHRLRERGMTPTKAGDAFAAFYAIEYHQELPDADIVRAWNEVVTALTNLLSMGWLLGTLRIAEALIPQRTLAFTIGETTVRAVPDLVAFFSNQPPLIVDWKVHFFGTTDYRLQLLCYALALTQCTPHKDFPESLADYDATDVRLVEAQLLTGQLREYSVSDSDVDEVELYIFQSATEMMMAIDGDGNRQTNPYDLPPTEYPENCQRCAYRSLCWKESSPWDTRQMSLL